MDCFDHGREFVGLCGWCGKQVCAACIGRVDGRKKYCHQCAAKMGEFQPKERTQDRIVAHEQHKASVSFPPQVEPYGEEPGIETLSAAKPPVRIGHPKHLRLDPKIFELDDDEYEPREEERSEPQPVRRAPPAETTIPSRMTAPPRENPTPQVHDASSRPQVQPYPPYTSQPRAEPSHQSPMPQAHHSPTQPQRVPIPPQHREAAQNAMHLFAAQAKQTMASSSRPQQSAPAQRPASFTPRPVSQPPRPSSAPPKNSGSDAAAKAFSFLAASAKETQKKE